MQTPCNNPGTLSVPRRPVLPYWRVTPRFIRMTRLEPGTVAPPFTLSDDEGNTVSLADYAGSRVVVYFYPAAMTPGCTTEACDFRDNLESLQAAGVVVLGISGDKIEKLAKFRARDHLTFPLLSDPDHEVMTAYGAWGEKTMYGKKMIGVIRSTFIINGDGTIAEALYNVRAKGHVARVRGLLGLD